MQYTIETLTPLQIGNGNQYNSMNSIITNNYFYAIDTDKLHEKLYDEGLLEEYLDHLSKKKPVKDYLDKIDYLEPQDIQKYQIELTQQNKRDIQYLEKHDISQFIKNGNGEVYIPGTEIKGGIRTALLYHALLEDNNYQDLRRELEKIRRKNLKDWEIRRELRYVWKRVERRIFRGKRDDPKYDLLKYLEISDSSTLSPTSLQIGHTMAYWSRGKHNYGEVLPAGTTVSGTINIITRRNALEDLGLTDKAGILAKDNILEAIYTHTNDLIKHERRFYIQNRVRHTPDFLGEIKSLQEANTPESPVLVIGQGQGFLSTTISLIVKNQDPSLYDVIRRGARGKSYRNNFPKTRRFLVNDGGPKHRFGWVKLEVE